MDNKSIQTEPDNTKDRQPLPDPEQIGTGRSMDDMMDYYAAIGYAICKPDITTEEEAAALDEATRKQILGENPQQIGQAKIAAEKLKEIQDNIKTIRKDIGLRISFDEMVEFYRSGQWKESRRQLYRMMMLAPIADEISKLSPYFEKEIEKPEYEGKTIDDLLEEAELNEEGELSEDCLLYKAWKAASEAQEKETPHAAVHRTDSVEYPLDKPNARIWKLLEEDTAGQIAFNLAKKGSKTQLLAYYSIDFDELKDIKITKRLLMFDKLVYIAISALFNAGNNIITLPQIYYAMGYKGTPGRADKNKINDSITKMMGAKIFFDNKEEASKYKKYDRFLYDGPLLPVERGTAIVNGQMMDVAIHIFREPPMVTFAKQRKQITTLDIKLLQAPVSKTDGNLQIQDYLLERISKAKNTDSKTCRILFDTLYKNTGIEAKPKTEAEKSTKRRTPDKIRKYLTHYKAHAFITDFSLDKDGLTVSW